MEDLEITSKMVLLTDGAQVVGPLDLEITRKMFFFQVGLKLRGGEVPEDLNK